MSTIYVTGARNRQKVEELAAQLRGLGKKTVVPFDEVDGVTDEHDALVARLKALLDCSSVVTTSPADGEWSTAAQRELTVARAADIPVIPAMRALSNEPNHHT